MDIKEYDKYKDIPEKYRWDLEDILQGKSLDYWMDKYKSLFEKRILIKDSKYESLEKFLADFKLQEDITVILFKITNYISNNINTNVVDAKFQALNQKFSALTADLNTRLGSEDNRIFTHSQKVKEWLKDPRMQQYKHYLESVLDTLEHKLNDEVENYIISTAQGTPSPAEVFSVLTNSELVYESVINSKNKKLKLTPTNRAQLLKSNDPKVRKGAYENYFKAFLKHKGTLSTTLYQQFKNLSVEAKVRNFNSAIESLTYSDRVPESVLLKLYKEVSSRKKVFIKYTNARKKFYKAKFNAKMQKWDYNRELVSVKSKFSVEEAKELVKKALKPFGPEYMEQIEKAMSQKWIDFMSAKGKRSGAYSIGGTYGIDKKYILMNFNGELRSVETLAHELGHSMHSYFSDTRQDLVNSLYPIFLAEIASIFNELMLFDYLLKTSDNDKLKFTILNQMIEGFLGTVNRQIEWSNYEYDLFKAIENNEPANSWDAISNIYFKNMNKYALKVKTKKDDLDLTPAIYVPHFYYHFYVYKYAVGQLSAIYFFAQYKKYGTEALENYVNNFLSAGSIDFPLNILKNNGIDLESDKFYNDGYEYVEKLVNQYVELGNKIFKFKK